MSSLSWYGLLALALIGAVFYGVRKIPTYAAASTLIVLGTATATALRLEGSQISEWVVLTLGLALCVFGLLIVRVMLVRSVSLRLLRSIEEGSAERMSEDIQGRLADMRRFKLIETPGAQCELTPFGRLVGSGISLFYSLFRIAT